MNDESIVEDRKQVRRQIGPDRLPVADVILVFHGLSGFWVNGDSCVVGFHTRGDHRHPLTIEVFDEDCQSIKLFSGNLKKLQLEIDDPNLEVADKALFYQPDGKRIRRDRIRDPYDFQWIIDFEARECYGNQPLEVSLSTYKPQIKVSPAIFFTLKTTLGKFFIRTADSSPMPGTGANFNEFGPVAEYIAANIYLIPNSGSVTLTVDGESKSISKGQIHFFNDCDDQGRPCEWHPKEPDKRKRNDFYLHYAAITSLPELELRLHEEVTPDGPPDVICPSIRKRSNDNAPCAGAGYGGGGGFPPYPEA